MSASSETKFLQNGQDIRIRGLMVSLSTNSHSCSPLGLFCRICRTGLLPRCDPFLTRGFWLLVPKTLTDHGLWHGATWCTVSPAWASILPPVPSFLFASQSVD